MKYLNSLIFLCFAAPLASFAQSPGAVGAVSVALTISYSKPGLVEREADGKLIPGSYVYENQWTIVKEKGDEVISEEILTEQSVKMGTFKYSNKEILLDLLFMEMLPEINGKPASISGWSIIQVTGEDDSEPQFFARHTSKVSVNISDMFQLASDEAGGAATVTGKSSSKTTNLANGDVKETFSASYSSTFKTAASFNMNEVFSGHGLLTGGSKLTLLSYKEEGETYQFPIYVPTAMKLANISGSAMVIIPVGEEDVIEASGVLEGSFSVGAGKAYLDIESYLTPDFDF